MRLLKVGTEGDITGRGIPAGVYQELDAVLCQTPSILAEARGIGMPAQACLRVRNGLPLASFAATVPSQHTARASLTLPREAFVVLGLGRLTVRKRFTDLIAAYAAFVNGLANKASDTLASPADQGMNGRADHSLPADDRAAPTVLLIHGSDFGQDDGVEADLRRQAVAAMRGRATSGSSGFESSGSGSSGDATDCRGQRGPGASARSSEGCSAPAVDIRFVPPSVEPGLTLAAADVMVTLSEREGAPNIFIEAFAAGLPVLASDLSGHRVYLRHGRNGLLIPVGDIRAAVAGLRSLAADPVKRAAMSRAAARSASRFDIADTATDYLRAFALTRQRKGIIR